MTENEQHIRDMIERWARAVHSGDLAEIVADRAADIVMFDVPPPFEGVRGSEAYRETWPSFIEWQAQGASFEIEELHVTAGEEVAYAFALLRCGTEKELAERPDNRLRLTLGLRKEHGRWLVAHEHHSFPLDGAPATDEQDLRHLHQRWFDQTAAKDLDGMMASIADDVVSYEHDGELSYLGRSAVREVCRKGLEAAGDAEVTWAVPDLNIQVDGDLAVAWGLNVVRTGHPSAPTTETRSRGTRVFHRNGDGTWLMIHQHLSYPAR